MTKIFGIEIHTRPASEIRETVCRFLVSGKPHQIATVNPEMLVAARRCSVFHRILSSCDLRVADGVGVCLLISLLFQQGVPERITGVEILDWLLEDATQNRRRVFFLGAEEGRAEAAAVAVRRRYPSLSIDTMSGGNIAFFGDQWHLDPAILDRIRIFQPEILAVALGHEKQERWIYDFLPQLPSVRVAIGVGGAFAFLSGAIHRAPQWMRSVGLEWMWRLLLQPKRFGRIFTAVVVFPILAIFDRIRPVSNREIL